ncbi:6-pyruvoyl tetrahydrobiopterin synthase [Eurytemora carolleeae]|uniref:6-pyruvoyl tetrahydrobiopterin synthase n=1 Tax=Eurytemora carolleeae TaxID=1294199 RepID=UPI000C768A16|nr:6-pyruvoyl tetrahydrobiopterin synthase [Eurytemora carolleeae]|eukprot:XP_023343105.1 6-pyruvoyl tetrahydrobiopterin synthase-like [Eurytemora affinis]
MLTKTNKRDGWCYRKQENMTVYITRRESFSAAHRLHNPGLSAQENLRIFGKCNNPHGHGHNYNLEVTVRGKPDRETGMVMNITDIKTILNENVLNLLDHRNIDKEVDWFKNGRCSTAENLVIFIWNQIHPLIPHPAVLDQVKLWETEKNIAIYRGEE